MAARIGWIIVGLAAGYLIAVAITLPSPSSRHQLVALLLLVLGGVAALLLERSSHRAGAAAGPADAGPGAAPGAVVGPPADPRAPNDELVSVERLPDPTILLDSRLCVVAANAAAVQLHARSLVGEDLAIAVRHPMVHEAVKAALTDGTPLERDLTGLGQPEGLVRLRIADAARGRLLLSFIDISQARAVERMRADFIANASHELRTPLATILGFIETLQGPAAEDEPARARFLGIMAREARRMARLIEDLMSLSRIELDKYVRPLTPLALAPLLAEVGRTLAMQLEEAGSSYRLLAAPDLPPVIADRDQLLQVMHNLVSNSLKYGRAGTTVTVSATLVPAAGSRSGAVVRVSVADEGPGVAPEHLPRLTERFYRVDPSRSRQMHGTGLGLAIVKHIVERHRGELTIASELGVGTTVSFTLPVAQARRAASDQVPGEAAKSAPIHRNETELS